jgi:hypothetical protein
MQNGFFISGLGAWGNKKYAPIRFTSDSLALAATMIAKLPMLIHVDSIVLPAGSTIGYGTGVEDANGQPVTFCGEHRAMRHLGEVLAAGESGVEAEVEDWQLLGGCEE